MEATVAHGRTFPPRGTLTADTASGLKVALTADPRSIPALAREIGISHQHLYNLAAGHRRPSHSVAVRIIEALDLDSDLADALLAESSEDVLL